VEPFTEARSHDEELWAAHWRHGDGLVVEHARLLRPPSADGISLAGAWGGLIGRFTRSIVWHLMLAPDWTATSISVTPDEPWGEEERGLDIRFDGGRRWHDPGGRELHPDTRDGRFLAWEGSASCHTPVLRHIGLGTTGARDVDVLVLDPSAGWLVTAPWRYTPLGDGRWHVEMAQTRQRSLDVVVDDHGIVTSGCGELVLRHRPGREA
jgi:hypothetical protein